MLANYGYTQGSGEFFITIDTDRCDGCGRCAVSCPAGVLEVVPDDNDPMREQPVAKVTEAERKKIKYTCGPCKPNSGARALPCQLACSPGAIAHSW